MKIKWRYFEAFTEKHQALYVKIENTPERIAFRCSCADSSLLFLGEFLAIIRIG